MINTGEDRATLLARAGIEKVLVLPTTKDVMSTSWEQFLEDLIHKDAIGFVCGEDFRFGHRGEGNAEKLLAFCNQRKLSCVIIPDQQLRGVRISSTHIRNLLEAGDVESAACFLGHPHVLSGEVMPGRQLGRTIGVPTANITPDASVLLPPRGVYATYVIADGVTHRAVTNIGTRPTVNGDKVTIESWLLDFNDNLYNSELIVQLVAYLRPESKYDSLEDLKAQIDLDVAQARAIFQEKE